MKSRNDFEIWADWYGNWKGRQAEIPWQQHKALTMAERLAIQDSIAEFQLGESSDGKLFFAAAVGYAGKSGDASFAEAIRDFIREENRHSEMLGRFMDLEGISRIKHSRVDGIFRRIRHMASHVVSHRILVTAEFIAVPYYRALSKATCSPVLNAICKQILEDEARHIAFQAAAIRALSSGGTVKKSLHHSFSRLLLEIALDVVWWNHSDVMRRGGYTFGKMRAEAIEQFDWCMGMVANEIPIQNPKQIDPSQRSPERDFHVVQPVF